MYLYNKKIKGHEILIGRDNACNIIVQGENSKYISDRHLVIRIASNRIYATCLGFEGIIIDQKRVTYHESIEVYETSIIIFPGCNTPLLVADILRYIEQNNRDFIPAPPERETTNTQDSCSSSDEKDYKCAIPAPHQRVRECHQAYGSSDTETSTCSSQTSLPSYVPKSPSWRKKAFTWLRKKWTGQEEVHVAVFAPSNCELGQMFTIQAMLYLNKDMQSVINQAKMVDPSAEKKNGKTLDLSLKKGTPIQVSLKFFYPQPDCPQISIEQAEKEIIWDSRLQNLTFQAFLPYDYKYKSISGNIHIRINQVEVAKLSFLLSVQKVQTPVTYALVDIQYYRKIFISYSHKDTDKVQYIAEAYKAINLDYFFDRHSLKPGDKYKDIIFKHIDDADLFILCWSKNAKESQWVNLECNRFIENTEKKDNHTHIHPISIAPKVDFPKELEERYHFGELE